MEYIEPEVLGVTLLFVSILVITIWSITFKIKQHFGDIQRWRHNDEPPAENPEQAELRQQRRRNRNEGLNQQELEWPIWIGELKDPVQLTCSHDFWGVWLMNVYDHTGQQIKCPMCRTSVSVIFKEFEPNEENQELREKIKRYNRIYAENRSFLEFFLDAPYILRRWFGSIHGFAGLIQNLRLLTLLTIALLYILSPFDIIPESVFGVIGLLDDIFVFVIILLFIAHSFLNEYLRNQ